MKTAIFFQAMHNSPGKYKYLRYCHLYLIPLILIFSAPKLWASPPQPHHNQSVIQWQLDKTVGGVEFYFAISTCNKENVVFLKMNNKNNYPVEVSWKEVFQTQLEKNKEGFAGTKKITISPGETFESDCNTIQQPLLIVLAGQISPTYIATISGFSFKDISVTKKQ